MANSRVKNHGIAHITTWLIPVNGAVFILQQSFGNALIANFALWPLGSHFAQDLNATVGLSVVAGNNLRFATWQRTASAARKPAFGSLIPTRQDRVGRGCGRKSRTEAQKLTMWFVYALT